MISKGRLFSLGVVIFSFSIAVLLYYEAFFRSLGLNYLTYEPVNILDTVNNMGFLSLWLSNPILVGGSFILAIYLD